MDIDLIDNNNNNNNNYTKNDEKMLKQRLNMPKPFNYFLFYLKKYRHLRFCVIFFTCFVSIYIIILIKFSKKPDALDYFPEMCHVYPNDLSKINFIYYILLYIRKNIKCSFLST